MLRNSRLEHIYILNDEDQAKFLNDKYSRSNFFIPLPDPILIPPKNRSVRRFNLPTKPEGMKRFLVFGSLSERKGIFLILDVLQRLSNTITQQVEFVFAGKIVDQSRDTFFKALDTLRIKRPNLRIHYLDIFVPYASIPEMFLKSDFILVPYLGSQASSGILGHAALYRKPVIGPDRGLVGKLIRSYSLGTTIAAMDANNLAESITNFSKKEKTNTKSSEMQRYVEERHPTRFVETLFMN